MKATLKCLVLALSTFLLADQALANPCPPGNPPTNCAPPLGWILDLAPGLVPNAYTNYTVDFVAVATTTNLSFAFREDPAFLFLDDVSVTDVTNPSGELVVNGGFEAGLGPWVALNTFGATFAGVIGAGGHLSANAWVDGSVQAYDGLTQSIATNIGDLYHISFFLNDNGPLVNFQQLSTNGNVTNTGGNGIDLLVYAGEVPRLAPEPATLALLGMGLAGIGFARRRKAG